MLSTRLATAAVGIPLVALAVWVGGWLVAGVTAVAVFVASIEFAAARSAMRLPVSAVAAASAAALPLVAVADPAYFLGAVVAAVLLQGAAFTFSSDPKTGLDHYLWGVVSVAYLGLLASHFVLLREAPDGRDWLVFALVTVWSTDTGAYAVGRMIGRHKLAPAISPGKTVEGGLGSAVTGLVTVFILDAALGLDLATGHLVALGLLLPPVILVGDLAESALKRALGVKDSSGLIPGHGGVADRLDSLLFAVPVVYWYMQWIIL